ncbi:MAG: CBS domain-containing protein [Candidatus Omnitrophica bacterium]|nr:CBS domain-containing protein [Candidatus Omnitrophota bacterium]
MTNFSGELTVGDLMQRYVLVINKSATVQDAVNEMKILNVGSILVVDDNRALVGIFSERDLLIRVVGAFRQPADTPISDVMTRNVRSVTPSVTARDALKILLSGNFRHLPVIDGNGKLEGVVSLKDIGKII